tara:strand:- start:835 stop:1161 length:327 start_codon:yes stop_codon:yes gene_type:complete
MDNLEDYAEAIKKIKMRMKLRDDISEDQVKGYNRRLLKSPVLQVHVELLQQTNTRSIQKAQLLVEKEKEIKHLEMCLHIQAQKAKTAEQFIIDEFGKKSYEWAKYKSI